MLSLTLREGYILGLFEGRMLRRILESKRDYVVEGWKKQHNDELHDSWSSPSIITMIKSRKMRWEGRVARLGEKRQECRLLVGKPEEIKPLGRPRPR
jgi:hypothetical protein